MAQNSLDVGSIKVRVLDDGIFVTDAGNLFGPGTRQAKIRGAMHSVLVATDDALVWALNPPSFPNATVYVQKEALEEAREMPEGDSRRETVPVVEKGVEEGWCKLLEGNSEVVEGLRVEVRSGHAEGHQISWIESGDDAALFTADVAPAKIWLNPDLISGVDTNPEAARKNRIEVLTEAEERDAPVILYHEPRDFLVRIRKTEEGFEGVPWEG
jgi:glyoxylase-like metal-dependent hydrolase (beta-lactamase superfamily II)